MRRSPVFLKRNRGHTSGRLPNPMPKIPFQAHTWYILKLQRTRRYLQSSRSTLRLKLRLQPQKTCLLHRQSYPLPLLCRSIHWDIWCRRLTSFPEGNTIPH